MEDLKRLLADFEYGDRVTSILISLKLKDIDYIYERNKNGDYTVGDYNDSFKINVFVNKFKFDVGRFRYWLYLDSHIADNQNFEVVDKIYINVYDTNNNKYVDLDKILIRYNDKDANELLCWLESHI